MRAVRNVAAILFFMALYLSPVATGNMAASAAGCVEAYQGQPCDCQYEMQPEGQELYDVWCDYFPDEVSEAEWCGGFANACAWGLNTCFCGRYTCHGTCFFPA